MEESLEQNDALASLILSDFKIPTIDIRTVSPLSLAWLGDTVFDLVVRTYITGCGSTSPNKMQIRASHLVSAEAQAKMLESLQDILSDEEKDIVRRGRNAKPKTMAKNASGSQYHKATGLEALIGYLYLIGNMNRCIEIIRYAVTESENAK